MNLLTPVTLKGKYATLVPLSMEHCAALIEAAKDGELWNILVRKTVIIDAVGTQE